MIGISTLAVSSSLLLIGPVLADPPPHLISGSPHLTKINKNFTISQKQALDWAKFKSQIGPTYTGSAGGNQWLNFIETTMQEFGAVDLFIQDLPYSFFTVNDWPNPLTHVYGSGVEIEKLISNNVPVPVVASYGMTSGSTGANGLKAPMVLCKVTVVQSSVSSMCPPVTGKIAVFQTQPYPAATPNFNPPYEYSNSFLTNYTLTDFDYQSPGAWSFPMFQAVPPSFTSSHHSRWVWNQLGGFATTAMKGGAAGMIVVYDLSPAAAFGLIQRSVYSLTGNGGPGTMYQNVPTLCLDRVAGAQVLIDAGNGATATMTLTPSTAGPNGFVPVQGQYVIGYLPGKDYGTPQDQQILLSTHTDAMSLVEEDGAFGMLGIMYYMNHIPQKQRPRTLVFWFDSRHFMPGAEGAWSQYDFYLNNPQKLAPIVATIGMEHMGGRTTLETGPGGNDYVYSSAAPEDGGVIAALIDLNNNNPWLINTVATAAEDSNWPRVEATSAGVAPGVNGGFQKSVLSPTNKGRSYSPQIPGLGLAGDWPGAWTQEYSQLTTEAQGAFPGFDENYFVEEVAGLSEITGAIMAQDNIKIILDFGWGQIASGLTCTMASICTTKPSTGYLPDTGFVTQANAPTQRAQLVAEYHQAFNEVVAGKYTNAIYELQTLQYNITNWISDPNQTLLIVLINNQIAKLSSL
jgi:hypothetical protein